MFGSASPIEPESSITNHTFTGKLTVSGSSVQKEPSIWKVSIFGGSGRSGSRWMPVSVHASSAPHAPAAAIEAKSEKRPDDEESMPIDRSATVPRSRSAQHAEFRVDHPA